MVTVPWVLLVGGLVFLGLKWGGWKVLPVVVSVAFGLVFASTGLGGELTTWLQSGTAELLARASQAARWAR